MPSRLLPISVLMLSLCAWPVHADDEGMPDLSFSGFGTVGVVRSSEEQADFTDSSFKPSGAGYTHEWSPDVDTRLGLQVTANLTPRLSGIVQVIAEQTHDDDYQPGIEWANLKYALTPDLSVRAGRIVLPSFLVADYRKVSYVNPWVRPPTEVYNLIPITKSDGVDVSYRLRLGGTTNTFQGSYGRSSVGNPEGGQVHGRNQWAAAVTSEYESFTVHAAYFRSRVTIESLRPLFDSFRAFGPQGEAIADRYECERRWYNAASISASYDPGRWFLMGELARRSSDCFVSPNVAWFVSAGFRVGKFTPFATYAQVKANRFTDPGMSLAGLPPALAASAAGLNAGLDTIFAATPEQKTFSIGIRWDVLTNTAVKLQFDHTRIGDGSPGLLINAQPGFRPGGHFNLFSATVDFVF